MFMVEALGSRQAAQCKLQSSKGLQTALCMLGVSQQLDGPRGFIQFLLT